jgi:hypothetical protein
MQQPTTREGGYCAASLARDKAAPKLSYGYTRHETTCKDGDDDQLAGRPGTEVAVGGGILGSVCESHACTGAVLACQHGEDGCKGDGWMMDG